MLKFVLSMIAGAAVGLFAGAALPESGAAEQAAESGSTRGTASPISAVWANDGGDKVARGELRAESGSRPTLNSVWDGKTIRLYGGRNETVSFNLVLEAAEHPADDVTIFFDTLLGPGGYAISSRPISSRDGLFDWRSRSIELFRVGYLRIRGLSLLSYETYDERHVPERLRRPRDANGTASGGWTDRPDHDAEYPDIAIPLELERRFSIAAGTNQSVWVDITIPLEAPPGHYLGTVAIETVGGQRIAIPVALDVLAISLPETPAVATMVATSYEQVARRYGGNPHPVPGSEADRLARLVLQRQHMMAHRHRISLVDDNGGASAWTEDRPRPDWEPVLSGDLFTRKNGYAGPGEGVGNDVFAIGLYGGWRTLWGQADRQRIVERLGRWEDWFRRSAPSVQRFLYVADEPDDLQEVERIARWIREAVGPAAAVPTFATVDLLKARAKAPSLAIVGSWIAVADTARWRAAVEAFRSQGGRLWFYNGRRPASGSFAIDDDGVALRELAWGQKKHEIDRWFFWESTYYDDYQGGRGPTDVFAVAQTFGGSASPDPILGMTGWNASNGDGVLFYPGTDRVFPNRSYDLAGPMASLRLKHWRRGIEDVAYVRLAEAIDPAAARAIVQRMVPKVLWEVGVDDPSDPTWARTDIAWSTNPDDWERARSDLAAIILRKR